MTRQIFELRPFPAANLPTDVSVMASIVRRSNVLTVQYTLKDLSSRIAIPETVDIPHRKNHLWEETCFECFIAQEPVFSTKTGFSNLYWEFNLSPSSNWNVYHFDAYRQGMKEEPAFSTLPFRVNRSGDSLTLEVEIDLGKIGLGNLKIQVGISAVVKSKNGEVNYWALAHCGKQPDFHLRESFVVKI